MNHLQYFVIDIFMWNTTIILNWHHWRSILEYSLKNFGIENVNIFFVEFATISHSNRLIKMVSWKFSRFWMFNRKIFVCHALALWNDLGKVSGNVLSHYSWNILCIHNCSFIYVSQIHAGVVKRTIRYLDFMIII